MGIRDYLPSRQFAFILGAVVVSIGFVYGADYITSGHAGTLGTLTTTKNPSAQNAEDWLQTLRDIQTASNDTLPPSPNPDNVSNLLTAAQSPTVTETVARSLFIKLSEAKAEGLGDDLPTQSSLIADAIAQVSQNPGGSAYIRADLTTVSATPETFYTYGNAVIKTMENHPKANFTETVLALGYAADYHDTASLEKLSAIGPEYQAIANELAQLPVPETLAPLHLQIVNDFVRMAGTYPDMAAVLEDPLRGLGGLQLYQSMVQEVQRLLTNIAQQFAKNAILFDKSEPGAAWSVLLSLQQ